VSTGPVNEHEVWRRVGDASAAPTLLHARPWDDVQLEDLRQSFNTTPLMLRSWNYNFGLAAATLFGSPSGAPLHSDGLIPADLTWPSPQFFHATPSFPEDARFGQSPAPRTYVIVDADTVEFYDFDGAYAGYYQVGDEKYGTFLRHFAVAPDDEHWAAIVDTGLKGGLQTGQLAGFSVLWMGTFTDGPVATLPLGFIGSVNELVWHPDGGGVFADFGYDWVRYFSLQEGKGSFIDERYLPIPSLTHLDVNKSDGRILILIPQWFLDESELRTAGAPSAGLYVSPSDATDFEPVDLEPLIFDPQNARWVDSWRLQPGQNGGGRVR
jgi:hypothetical protein